MRITRLELRNWRNFRAVDIDLQDRAFFVGPNASGKSNLLDAVRFLRDVANPTGGGLQQAVAKRGGIVAVRCLAARRDTDVTLAATLGDAGGARWRYEVRFNAIGRDPRPFVRAEVVTRCGDGEETEILRRPTPPDETDTERLTETFLERAAANGEFREVAEFLRSVVYLHAVPQIIREPWRKGDAPDDPYGGHLLAQINEAKPRNREARLKRMSDALKIAVPQLGELQLEVDREGAPHLKAKFSHWRPQGAWQREDQFSDGTLRLLGLIWALTGKGGPLLLEEPELSLHGAVVAQLPAVIRRASGGGKGARQSLITSHASALLRDPGIGLDEVFVLQPAAEGTAVTPAASLPGVRAMLENGTPLPDAVEPFSRPQGVEDLPLFA